MFWSNFKTSVELVNIFFDMFWDNFKTSVELVNSFSMRLVISRVVILFLYCGHWSVPLYTANHSGKEKEQQWNKLTWINLT